jgi:predicted acyl esterase
VPFAALVPMTTWVDLYSALLPGNLSKSGAVLGFLSALPAERFAPIVNELRSDLLRSTNLPRIRDLARDRSSLHLLDRVQAPVFMLQGRRDFAFDPRQAFSAYRALRVPKRLYVGDLGHAPAPNPARERPYYFDQVRQWFDRWLKGLPNGIDTRPPIEVARDPWTGRTASYRSPPPTTGLKLAFSGTSTLRPSTKVVRTVRLPRRLLETFGSPVLRVSGTTRTGWPYLVAVLSALTPDRRELVVSAGGVRTASLRTRRASTMTLRLIDQATTIPAGSRLRLTLATSSSAQSAGNVLYLPFEQPDRLRLSIRRVRLTLPVLRRPVSR